MWDDFLRAFALMLVFEGILPFVAPRRWRHLVEVMGRVNEKALRAAGLASMLAGLVVLYLVNRPAL